MKLTNHLLNCLMAFAVNFIALNSSAQLKESFEDGNIFADPEWTGDTSKFKVIAGKLQSQSSISNDKFYLSAVSKSIKNTQWEFFINLQFNTSSVNYADIFLTSDSSNLPGNNSGYFLRIGNSADNIGLFKKNGNISTPLIIGKGGSTNHSNNLFKIKVTCDAKQNFTLWQDSTGIGANFIREGSVTDTTFKSTNFFGLLIRQSTAGFHKRHYFDDLYVGKIITDTIAPFVKNIEIKSPDTLRILFSEKLQPSSLIPQYFDIDNTIGNPFGTRFISADSSVMELVLVNSLAANTSYNFFIKNCGDMAGNFMKDTSFRLKWFQSEKPLEYDIVITELMPDPEPAIGLPGVEYVELYNSSSKVLELKNCLFGDKSSAIKLPSIILEPDSFLILCESENEDKFTPFGRTLGLPDFPSLNNSGDEIFIKDADGKLIHRAKYETDSYGDQFKTNGGWSLEMIDPDYPCRSSNFKASINGNGGTPGKKNSVNGPNPDNERPYFRTLLIKSDKKIILQLNEPLDSISSVNVSNYILTGNDIQSVICIYEILQINFLQPLLPNKVYSLYLKNLKDCSNNILKDTMLQIGIPEQAMPGDLIINEILFNPTSGGSDFIEVYNRSAKIISLKHLTLFNHDDNKQPDDLRVIDTLGATILPGQFRVFTSSPAWLSAYYKNSNSSTFISMASLPSMNDDRGHIGLTDGNGIVIDELDYDRSMHLQLLTDFEGVSLERISFDIPATETSNWTSAASTYGFATPGLANSHFFAGKVFDDWLTIEPSVFSPDDDGIADISSFSVKSQGQAQQATLIIFDSYGRLINTLANNVPVGNDQTWFWDGTDKENKKTPIGIYIVYAELFGLDGKKQVKKKTVTVGGK